MSQHSQIELLRTTLWNTIIDYKKLVGVKKVPRFEQTHDIIESMSKRISAENIALGDMDAVSLIKNTIDAISFIEITRLIKKIRSDKLPRRELSIYVNGNAYTPGYDFADNNDASRNHQFEFELAVTLARAGFSITGFNDVQASYNGTKFNFQCKRIRSLHNVPDNMKVAYEQLVRNKQMGAHDFGIIAISISIPLELEDKYVQNIEDPAVDDFFKTHTNNISSIADQFYQTTLSPNLLGALSFIKFPRLKDWETTISSYILEHFNHRSSRPVFNQMRTALQSIKSTPFESIIEL